MNNLIGVKDISPSPKLSIFLAVYFAELVLPIFEEKYPDDLRPRKAIEVAKTVLESGQPAAADAADAAYAAASAADNAANAANAAHAAYAAQAAAYAAVHTAYAATYAANAANAANAASYTANAANAASYASYAANAAASAAQIKVSLVSREEYIHNYLVKVMHNILDLKIEEGRPFENLESVFDVASSADKEKILFNIDKLR